MMDINELPHDPAMLLSVVNMKLRDSYDGSVERMADDMATTVDDLLRLMADAGWEWNPAAGKFW